VGQPVEGVIFVAGIAGLATARESVARAWLMSVTRAVNRSYLPASNSRLTFAKFAMPGNAQNR
jgi:hypothetical protein